MYAFRKSVYTANKISFVYICTFCIKIIALHNISFYSWTCTQLLSHKFQLQDSQRQADLGCYYNYWSVADVK